MKHLRSSQRQGRSKGRTREKIGIERIRLDSGLEGQKGIAGICHLEDASEAVLGQVANLEDLQIGGIGAQVQLGDDDVVDDDGRLGGFIKSSRQQLLGTSVETRVGHERRPVEVERHSGSLEWVGALRPGIERLRIGY